MFILRNKTYAYLVVVTVCLDLTCSTGFCYQAEPVNSRFFRANRPTGAPKDSGLGAVYRDRDNLESLVSSEPCLTISELPDFNGFGLPDEVLKNNLQVQLNPPGKPLNNSILAYYPVDLDHQPLDLPQKKIAPIIEPRIYHLKKLESLKKQIHDHYFDHFYEFEDTHFHNPYYNQYHRQPSHLAAYKWNYYKTKADIQHSILMFLLMDKMKDYKANKKAVLGTAATLLARLLNTKHKGIRVPSPHNGHSHG